MHEVLPRLLAVGDESRPASSAPSATAASRRAGLFQLRALAFQAGQSLSVSASQRAWAGSGDGGLEHDSSSLPPCARRLRHAGARVKTRRNRRTPHLLLDREPVAAQDGSGSEGDRGADARLRPGGGNERSRFRTVLAAGPLVTAAFLIALSTGPPASAAELPTSARVSCAASCSTAPGRRRPQGIRATEHPAIPRDRARAAALFDGRYRSAAPCPARASRSARAGPTAVRAPKGWPRSIAIRRPSSTRRSTGGFSWEGGRTASGRRASSPSSTPRDGRERPARGRRDPARIPRCPASTQRRPVARDGGDRRRSRAGQTWASAGRLRRASGNGPYALRRAPRPSLAGTAPRPDATSLRPARAPDLRGQGQLQPVPFRPRVHQRRVPRCRRAILVSPGRVDTGRHEGIRRLQVDRFNLLGVYSDDPSRATATKTRHVEQQHATFGQFKTPSLRNVALTAPYMHDGRYATLREVVRHYSDLDMERIHTHGEQLLRPLKLSESEIDDLVAFLESLTAPTQRRRHPRPRRSPAVPNFGVRREDRPRRRVPRASSSPQLVFESEIIGLAALGGARGPSPWDRVFCGSPKPQPIDLVARECRKRVASQRVRGEGPWPRRRFVGNS